MIDLDQKIIEIKTQTIDRIWDCRYEKDKIHIYVTRAIQELRMLLKDYYEGAKTK